MRAVEMTYLKVGLGVTRVARVRNEEVYEAFGMAGKAYGVIYGVECIFFHLHIFSSTS